MTDYNATTARPTNLTSSSWSLSKCKLPSSSGGNSSSTSGGGRSIDEYLWIYVAPVILVFGLVGNLLTIAVMCRRRYAGTNVQVYMLMMAVFDTLVLITAMIPEWLKNSSIFSFRDVSPATCSIEKLFAYVTGDTAIWILCAFTVDRCLAVCFPLRKNKSCKPIHAWLTCVSLFIAALAKNMHVLWTRGPEYCISPSDGSLRISKMCGFPTDYVHFEKYVRPWIVVAMITCLPFTILLVCNIFIIKQLINAQRMRAAAMSSTENSFRQTIVMCLSISFVFLATTAPSIVLVIGRPYWKPNDDPNPGYDVIKAINNQLAYVNHSINFWLYCITGRAFRNELLLMLGCKRIINGDNNHQLSVTLAQSRTTDLRRSNQKLVGSKLEVYKASSRETIDKV